MKVDMAFDLGPETKHNKIKMIRLKTFDCYVITGNPERNSCFLVFTLIEAFLKPDSSRIHYSSSYFIFNNPLKLQTELFTIVSKLRVLLGNQYISYN